MTKKKEETEEEDEPSPSDEFLGKLKDKQVKVYYFLPGEENPEPVWFEGKFTGFNKNIIVLESDTDFKKIERTAIESLYLKK